MLIHTSLSTFQLNYIISQQSWQVPVNTSSLISLLDLMASAIQPSLKYLSASGLLSSLPSVFISRGSEAAGAESVKEEEIPVIDLSLLRGNQEQRLQAIRDLGLACQEWSFFMVVNHGVPEGLRGSMLAALEEFFDLTDTEKTKYTKKKVLDPIQFGTGNNAPGEEVSYWRDFLKVIVHPEFNSPAKPPGLREVLQEYTTSTRKLARELLKGIWESLELDISSMDDALGLDSCFEILAANLYPPCPQPELAFGLPPHSDIGLLTVLIQNGIDGLEVKHNNRWILVKALPNSFFINIGDQMEIFSNGKYKSVLHRATVNNKSTRYSVGTVIGPSMEAIVAPAPELLIRDGNRAHYQAMKFGDYARYQQNNKLKEKSALDHIRLSEE